MSLFFVLTSISINLFYVAPYGIGYQQFHLASGVRDFKITSININKFNSELHLVKDFISQNKPDILILLEITPEMATDLSWLAEAYTYGNAIFQRDNFGIGIFSKYQVTLTEVHREKHFNNPLLTIDTTIEGQDLRIIATHSFPPIHRDGHQSRKRYLSLLTDQVAQARTVLACGDFNMTPWTDTFRNLLIESNLTAPPGIGTFATWPAFKIGMPIIPIDHCLYKGDLLVSDYKRGPYLGSDHYPISMTFSFGKQRQPTGK